jgi:hypothetical protein
MVMLGDGSDILPLMISAAGGSAWPELAVRIQELEAPLLEEAEFADGHGHAPPAAGDLVRDGPHPDEG